MRADLFLLDRKIASSRQKAKEMILSGIVYCDGVLISKPSENIKDGDIEIRGNIMPYVSRGGLKLKGALDSFRVNPEGLVCVDVGASSGGFTDCLLQHGAKKVYAVDCGHGQLAKKLLLDSRVVSLENQNARELSCEIIPEPCELAVMDVSFISQTLIYDALSGILKKNALFISLIKPQFEAGRGNIGKNGIVKNPKTRIRAVENVLLYAAKHGFKALNLRESPIKGGDGNTEYIALFLYQGDFAEGFDKNLLNGL